MNAWRIGFLAMICGSVVALSLSQRSSSSVAAEPAPTPQQVFEDRIMPIFNSPNPSSCTQCHLAGVDIKNYILPSHEKTFRSLRDQGLINLDRPAESKILKLIQRGGGETPGAALIHEKTRRAEYEAFASWIEASCADPRLRNAPALAAEERNPVADQPIEEVSLEDDSLVQVQVSQALINSFTKTIWADQNRCNACHMVGGKNNAKLVAQNGARMNWMKREGAAATVRYLATTKLIDVKEPEKSLLLLKPLGEVEHGGGKKMKKEDACYTSYLSWLKEYAAANGKKSAQAPADLPADRTAAVFFLIKE